MASAANHLVQFCVFPKRVVTTRANLNRASQLQASEQGWRPPDVPNGTTSCKVLPQYPSTRSLATNKKYADAAELDAKSVAASLRAIPEKRESLRELAKCALEPA
jgi:hypothetical protein